MSTTITNRFSRKQIVYSFNKMTAWQCKFLVMGKFLVNCEKQAAARIEPGASDFSG